jgi:hypothetical protein
LWVPNRDKFPFAPRKRGKSAGFHRLCHETGFSRLDPAHPPHFLRSPVPLFPALILRIIHGSTGLWWNADADTVARAKGLFHSSASGQQSTCRIFADRRSPSRLIPQPSISPRVSLPIWSLGGRPELTDILYRPPRQLLPPLALQMTVQMMQGSGLPSCLGPYFAEKRVMDRQLVHGVCLAPPGGLCALAD